MGAVNPAMTIFSRALRVTSVAVVFLVGCTSTNDYECIERTQKEVPNQTFEAAGTHTEVDYVLLHDGHKIYAICDLESVGDLDPTARCGFRPLRTYPCTLQSARIETGPISDLKCQDADGHNVYLWVTKKE